jgi:hypothetical protein
MKHYQKLFEKIKMQWPFTKKFLSNMLFVMVVFFFKKRDYCAFIVIQMPKTHFLNEISFKTFKFPNGPRYN